METLTTNVGVKVETAVSKGLLTYAGLAGSLGQYAVAVALYLASDDKVLALGPLGTATATLLAVIAARASQANAVINSLAEGTAAKVDTIVPDASTIVGAVIDDNELADDDGLPEYTTHTGDVPPDQGDPGIKSIEGSVTT
jgi:hypothetical protein